MKHEFKYTLITKEGEKINDVIKASTYFMAVRTLKIRFPKCKNLEVKSTSDIKDFYINKYTTGVLS